MQLLFLFYFFSMLADFNSINGLSYEASIYKILRIIFRNILTKINPQEVCIHEPWIMKVNLLDIETFILHLCMFSYY